MRTLRRLQNADVIKRRPKDRKAQIKKASMQAFGQSGYHAVSMHEIASRVGISAPALYRHSACKYDLFRDALLELGQGLVAATDSAKHVGEDMNPRAALSKAIDGLINSAVAQHPNGSLLRWGGSYLNDTDRVELASQIKIVTRRLDALLGTIRPGLTPAERQILSTAALSVIGSISDQRAALTGDEMKTLPSQLAHLILAADLPAPYDGKSIPAPPVIALGLYETIRNGAMRLFSARGYHKTTMTTIATTTGVPVSTIYRYFPSKSELLTASFRLQADRTSADLSAVPACGAVPEDSLSQLISRYSLRSTHTFTFGYADCIERTNLAPAEQATLHHIERSTVEAWSKLLRTVKPQTHPRHSQFAVHAAFTLAADLPRMRNCAVPPTHECLTQLMKTLILCPPSSPPLATHTLKTQE